MTGFVIAEIEVIDASRYEDYKKLATAAVSDYGGRYLSRGGRVQLLEGAPAPRRVVVLQFDSFDRAVEWYNSPEYRKAMDARKAAATCRMVALEA